MFSRVIGIVTSYYPGQENIVGGRAIKSLYSHSVTGFIFSFVTIWWNFVFFKNETWNTDTITVCSLYQLTKNNFFSSFYKAKVVRKVNERSFALHCYYGQEDQIVPSYHKGFKTEVKPVLGCFLFLEIFLVSVCIYFRSFFFSPPPSSSKGSALKLNT